MPSPVGHSLAGYAIYKLKGKKDRDLLFFSIIIANLPDIDFLGNLFIKGFHHGPLHSLFVSSLFGIIAGMMFRGKGGLFFSLYTSHILLDYLIKDPSPPYGIMLLWPFNRDFYMAPFAFFPSFDYIISKPEIFFSLHNLYTILFETALFLPLILLIKRIKK